MTVFINEYVTQLKTHLFNGDEQGFLKTAEQVSSHCDKNELRDVRVKLCHSFGLFAFQCFTADKAFIKSETHKRHKMLFDWLPLAYQLQVMSSPDWDMKKDATPEHVDWLKLTPTEIHNTLPLFSHFCQLLIQHKNIPVLQALFDRAAQMSPEFTPQFFLTLPASMMHLRYSEKHSRGSFVVCESHDDPSFIVAAAVWWNYSEELRSFVEQYEDVLNLLKLRNVLDDGFRSIYSLHGENKIRVEEYQINQLPHLDALLTKRLLQKSMPDGSKTKMAKKM